VAERPKIPSGDALETGKAKKTTTTT
jgi:hypothetical protein